MLRHEEEDDDDERFANECTEEERLGLVQGDSITGGLGPGTGAYEEEDEDYQASPSDEYIYDDDLASYAEDKSSRYGRGITQSPPRGRASSGSSSGNEQGLGISAQRDQGRRLNDTPPKPPAHGSGYGTPGSGSGAGGRGTPGGPAFL